MSLRQSYKVVTLSGASYHLTGKELRDLWPDIEPADPKQRKPGTRYSLVWTSSKTLKQTSPAFGIRGASCKPDQHSPQAVILSFRRILCMEGA